MDSFLIGVAASIVATLLITVLAWSKGWVKFTLRSIKRTHSLLKRIENSGITNFFSSRLDYAKYRGASSLLEYLLTAEKSIMVAGYWMSQGIEMEGISEKLAEMVKPPRNLKITIALIDPTASFVDSLSKYLGLSRDELVFRSQSSLYKLWLSREKLSEQEKDAFTLKVYDTIPIGSVILIDPEEDDGKLQIDIKPYKTPRNSSFSFEMARRGHPLYELCRDSWLTLLEEAEYFNPNKHLVGYRNESNEQKFK